MGLLSELIGAGQTPDPNPYYGAQYQTPQTHPGVTQPQWVDRNGVPITDPSFTSLHPNDQQAMASMPWKNPGFFGSLGTIGRQEKLANMEAEQYPGQQQQALNTQLNTAHNLIGQSPDTLRMMAAKQDLSGGNLQSWDTATAAKQFGVAPAVAQATVAEANKAAAEAPAGANYGISQATITQSDIARQRALEDQALLPGERELQQLGQKRQWWETSHIPSQGYLQPVIGQGNDVTMQRNYTSPMQTQLMGQALGGTIGSSGLANPYGGAPIMPGTTAGSGSGVSPITSPASGMSYPPSASMQTQGGNPNVIGTIPSDVGNPNASSKPEVSDEEMHMHPHEIAASDSMAAQHKLEAAALNKRKADLESAKQQLIATRKGLIGRVSDAVSPYAESLGANTLQGLQDYAHPIRTLEDLYRPIGQTIFGQ